MKLKVLPEDFQVTERLDLPTRPSGGSYSIYRLEKRQWNTVDAIAAAAGANSVPLSAIGYGGKKDRHALTVQFLSVPSRYRLDFESKNVSVRPVGTAEDYVSPLRLSGNEFSMTLRDLPEDELRILERGFGRVRQWGFANYFDDQRFGSVTGGNFLAERLIKGEYSGALQLFFCSIHPEDPAPLKALKAMRLQSWGDWKQLAALSRTKAERQVSRILANDATRHGLLQAINSIPREELSMTFSALQSALWNATLGELVRRHGKGLFEMPGRVAPTLHFSSLEPREGNPLEKAIIPTEAGKVGAAAEEVRKIMDEVLRARGLRRPQFNMREIRKSFFKSFPRKAVSHPEELSRGPFEPDELYPGRFKSTLEFFLPKGSYATMLLKALMGKI